EAAFGLLAVALLEIAGAEGDVLAVMFKEGPDDRQDAVSDGDERAFLAATRGHMVELAVEGGVFRVRNRVCSLGQASAQPLVALAGLAALAFAGAFVVAGAHRRPRREMGCCWEAFDVGADLGQQHLRRAAADAGYRV